jgi:hypothetical protein
MPRARPPASATSTRTTGRSFWRRCGAPDTGACSTTCSPTRRRGRCIYGEPRAASRTGTEERGCPGVAGWAGAAERLSARHRCAGLAPRVACRCNQSVRRRPRPGRPGLAAALVACGLMLAEAVNHAIRQAPCGVFTRGVPSRRESSSAYAPALTRRSPLGRRRARPTRSARRLPAETTSRSRRRRSRTDWLADRRA